MEGVTWGHPWEVEDPRAETPCLPATLSMTNSKEEEAVWDLVDLA